MSYPVSIKLEHPEKSSRLQLLFGWLIAIPSAIVLFFKWIGVSFIGALAWWVLLFTAKYPASWWAFVKNVYAEQVRLGFYLSNLTPTRGATSAVQVEITPPESWSRWRLFFGWVPLIPHVFVLFFLAVGLYFVSVISLFTILFAGVYPKALWSYALNTNRLVQYVTAYLLHLVHVTPPLSGKAD